MNGPMRFCEIESSIPISGRLLSERLKDLEKLGIVSRQVFPEVPVRVEYSLTEKRIGIKSGDEGITNLGTEVYRCISKCSEKIN